MGRPHKHNLRERGRAGWIELIFNPRSQVEKVASDVLKFLHPYIAFITYRFHLEKCRENGMRIEDFYCMKFHKEPYFMHHIYAQYFHPDTLLERVRTVRFIRHPRTMFKGFRVPDWATFDKSGWQVDAYSRQAWDNAMHDFRAECTPMQFWGERAEPNIIEWFRLEQMGKGTGSRLFYNEIPKPTWFRHQGHLDNPDDTLYSFTKANQDQQIMFGIDTTTEEGRIKFKKEYDAIAELTPELIKKSEMQYPHEMGTNISTEPHFRRLWSYYREHTLRSAIGGAVDGGKLAQADADAALKFLGGAKHLSVGQFVLGKAGLLPHLANDEGFLATDRAMEAVGMNQIPLDRGTAEPFEEQFWNNLDGLFTLNEVSMREELPNFIVDPSNRMKVAALMEGRADDVLDAEQTKQLAA